MRIDGKNTSYSPTDLVRFLESEFASFMDRFEKVVAPEKCKELEVRRDPKDPLFELLADLGNSHEATVLGEMSKTAEIVEINKDQSRDRCIEDTLKAMRDGADIIYQAALGDGQFFGYADILVKRQGKSKLGEHHYIPQDIKIASHPKANAIIQLCCYSDLLNSVQGVLPDSFAVIVKDGSLHTFKTSSFYFYYGYLKKAFLEYHGEFDSEKMPIPDKMSDHKDWTIFGKKVLHRRDDVSLTARIRSNHIEILREQEKVTTITELANFEVRTVSGIPLSTLETLIDQARLQVESRATEKPLTRLLSHSGKREGLELLPPPDAADIFFDMEGYPLLGKDGLEYLFGNTHKAQYKGFWAHSKGDEIKAFEAWAKWAFETWKNNRSMHIYHYGHYESSTIKRLMGAYGICEYEIDTLLRNQVFVDLNRVITQGLRVGGHSYSLKVIEKLYYPPRETSVGSGADAAVRFFHFLNSGESAAKSKFLKEIEDYNIDDCKSTEALARYLWDVQKKNKIKFIPFQEETPGEEKERKGPAGDCERKAKALLASVPMDKLGLRFEETTEELYLTELLAQLLQFHIREDKPAWQDYFARFEMGLQEKFEDPYTIADCRLAKKSSDGKWVVEFEPEQEIRFDTDDKVIILEHKDTRELYEIESIDLIGGRLTLVAASKGAPGPTGERFTIAPEKGDFYKINLFKSLLKTAQEFAPRKKNFGLRKCIFDLLTRKDPAIIGHKGKLIQSTEALIAEAASHALNMNQTVLCIQGPPGAGKTYTAAHMIIKLVQEGKRVAVTANSHNAILNLLGKVFEEKGKSKIKIQKVVRKERMEHEEQEMEGTDIELVESGDVSNSAHIVGGTTFFFSRGEQDGLFDYIFVDEASQVSLSNMVAAARSARNIILAGDQNQLDQPIQGSHPGESGKSALSYYVGDQVTIAEHRGIFFPISHRMHPSVCEFISQTFYNGALSAHKKTHGQRLVLAPDLKGKIPETGVHFIPVEHSGNMHSSVEEVEVIEGLYRQLLGSKWVDSKGVERSITSEDILIVAPYNLQVAKLKQAIGDSARIASVDKFQGQEAPVTILSMAASTIADAPRGISFFLNKNRMNVAISRAKCLSIVVGSSGILTPHLRSVEHIELMNVWSRLSARP